MLLWVEQLFETVPPSTQAKTLTLCAEVYGASAVGTSVIAKAIASDLLTSCRFALMLSNCMSRSQKLWLHLLEKPQAKGGDNALYEHCRQVRHCQNLGCREK